MELEVEADVVVELEVDLRLSQFYKRHTSKTNQDSAHSRNCIANLDLMMNWFHCH